MSYRYAVVQERDEDDAEAVWTRCLDADGLFIEPIPVERERLTLRGVSPGWAEADECWDRIEVVVQERETSGAPRYGDSWTLTDVVVVGRARTDVEIEAIPELTSGAGRKPAVPAFELFGRRNREAVCAAIDGLYRDRPEPPKYPVWLLGCEPPAFRAQRTYTEFRAYDRTGRLMRTLPISLEVLEIRPSAPGTGLVDIHLADGPIERPFTTEQPIWEHWYEGGPDRLNRWADFGPEGLDEYSLFAMARPTYRPEQSGGVHHVDTSRIADRRGLHYAISEAIRGPGGYYGWGWDALADCLCGGFGAVPPFTLEWDRDLRDPAHCDDEELRVYAAEVWQLLSENNVTNTVAKRSAAGPLG